MPIGVMGARLFCAYVTIYLLYTSGSVIPKPDHKDRVKNIPLSDEKHYREGDDHNEEYDHEAFLGRDGAKEFDQLTPDESKQKLGLLFDKIDKDSDGQISREELQKWIQYVERKYIYTETDKQWKELDTSDGYLTWDIYKHHTYGNGEDDDDGEMIERDRRRWEVADADGDKVLNKNEFAVFLHPEESIQMRDVIIDEAIADMDTDHDGFINLKEYLADIYDEDDEDEDQTIIEEEQEDFRTQYDRNGDGKLDRDEIGLWLMPDDYDHSNEETVHLFNEADTDKDNLLSKDEVLSKYKLFAGSKATDYGDAIARHDEF